MSEDDLKSMPYRYHVAYAHQAGWGRTSFYGDTPVTDVDQVREWELSIEAKGEVRNPIVISWQRFEEES